MIPSTVLSNMRSAKLLGKARYVSCIRCGAEGETRASHYCGFRQHMFGKGRGIKGDDLMTAEFCASCDHLFSEAAYGQWRGGSKNVARSEEFLFWIGQTNRRRIANGFLKVG